MKVEFIIAKILRLYEGRVLANWQNVSDGVQMNG